MKFFWALLFILSALMYGTSAQGYGYGRGNMGRGNMGRGNMGYGNRGMGRGYGSQMGGYPGYMGGRGGGMYGYI